MTPTDRTVPVPAQNSDVAVPSSQRLAPWAGEVRGSQRWSYALRLLHFLVVLPVIFALAVWMRYYLIVATVVLSLVIAEFFEPVNRLLDRFPNAKNMGLLGQALSVTLTMREFYREHQPASFLYYLFYPLTAPVAAVMSPVSRRELELWGRTFLALITADLLNLALAYPSIFPPSLGLRDALGFALIHVLVSLYFGISCLIPVATTAFTLGLAGSSRSLRFLVVPAAVLSIGTSYLVLQFTADRISLESAQLVRARLGKESFRKELKLTATIILGYSMLRTSAESKAKYPPDAITPIPKLTRIFRQMSVHALPNDEGKAFQVVAIRPDPLRPEVLWYGVDYTHGRKHHLLYLMDDHQKLLDSWQKVPPEAQVQVQRLYSRWQSGSGQFIATMAADFPLE